MSKKRPSKKKINKKLKKKSSLHSDTKKGILVVVSFTLAIVSLLSFFGIAGTFGQYFLKASHLFFGQGFFLVSIIFILIGSAILTPRFSFSKSKSPVYLTIFIGVFLFMISVLGIFHIIGPEIKAGGYIGMIIGHPLNNFLGFWASLVVLLSILIISFLITFNVSLLPSKKDDTQVDEIKPIEEKKQKPGIWSKLKDIQSKKKDDDDLVNDQSKSSNEEKEVIGGAPSTKAGAEKIKAAVLAKQKSNYKLPSLDYLERDKGNPTSGDIKANINIIKGTLENFGIRVEMAEVNVGPTVTQYTLRPAQGIKLTKITGLQNDLSLALAAHPLRIEAPIPGKSLVGIEIPNKSMVTVRLRTLLERPAFQESAGRLTFALGRDVAGNPIFAELSKMPHLLVAGATGTGKTVALNNIITSLLYRNFPEDMKMIMIDPKRVELSAYGSIPHLISPVIVQADKAVGALRWAVSEMERRFIVLQEAGKRDISGYNNWVARNSNNDEALPYIVIVIDELADLMSTYGREVEASIVRLAQMARAIGIHLIVSTQRPSVEVITGLIKANITSRMAFQVASQIDSRTILDMAGAEKLLGNGDMLFLAGNSAKPRRVQGAYVSEKEVKKVTDYLKSVAEPDYMEEVVLASQVSQGQSAPGLNFGSNDNGASNEDELLGEAKKVVVQAGKASASLLQRRLRVGYARAARLLDILEEQGLVGPADGARPRDVFIDEGAEENNL